MKLQNLYNLMGHALQKFVWIFIKIQVHQPLWCWWFFKNRHSQCHSFSNFVSSSAKAASSPAEGVQDNNKNPRMVVTSLMMLLTNKGSKQFRAELNFLPHRKNVVGLASRESLAYILNVAGSQFYFFIQTKKTKHLSKNCADYRTYMDWQMACRIWYLCSKCGSDFVTFLGCQLLWF